VALLVALSLCFAERGWAQLNGLNIKGDAGLKSGSQAPPGSYFVVPLYFYPIGRCLPGSTSSRSPPASTGAT
jgi:hypothetical protein